MAEEATAIRRLYVHVPFCPSICPWCNFHVTLRRDDGVEDFLRRLDEELADASQRTAFALDSLYLGGGTPSGLRIDELERLLASVRRHTGWCPGDDAEVTLEVHPSTADPDAASAWAGLGVNRFSIGAQSFDDSVLGWLERPHDATRARLAVECCVEVAEARVPSGVVAVDIMGALAGQRLADDLTVAVDSGARHVSMYVLTIEERTAWARRAMRVDDDDAAQAIDVASSVLGGRGFERYEVSNHARPDSRCRHNLGYWRHEPFLGVGPGAASLRVEAPRSPGGPPSVSRVHNPTLRAWLAGDEPEVAEVVGADLVTDVVLCGLRVREGLRWGEVMERTGAPLPSVVVAAACSAARAGLLEVDELGFRATVAGFARLDSVVASLCEHLQ
ncbi:MAG: coproporphyrinogen-III oxidase family protein [Microthrixaceae bacterium]